MLNKRIIYTFLLVIWMIIIFIFSNQSGTNSLKVSDNLTRNTINTVNKITNTEMKKKDKDKLVLNSRFIVRKIAHFTLYFILGILVYLTLSSYNIKKNILIFSILFVFIYAISDEVHQLLLQSRTFRFLDIFIDTIAGSISSTFINKMKGKSLTNN